MDGKAMAWVGALALAASAQAWGAPSNPMKPGAWESASTTTAQGKPLPAQVSSVCLDQAWIDAQNMFEPSKNAPIREAVYCKDSGYQRSGDKASWTTRCKLSKDGKSGDATIVSTRSASSASATFTTTIDAAIGSDVKKLELGTRMRLISEKCPDGIPHPSARRRP